MDSVKNTYGFDICTNVDIKLIETDTNIIKKHVVKHNKATRNMIKGILRFLQGRFNNTYVTNSTQQDYDPQYFDDAKNYIPCFISFGDGGITYNSSGKPEEIPSEQESTHIPQLPDSWNSPVDYNSKQLIREFTNLSHQRPKIRKQTDTLDLDPAGDMDTVVLYCEVAPSELNTDIVDGQQQPGPRFITEVGLFSNYEKTDNDLLAYVKLQNHETEGETTTDTIYVRPGDTVIITWYITVVAISDISVVDSSEELVEPVLGELIISDNT
jgi:hypothetical protein